MVCTLNERSDRDKPKAKGSVGIDPGRQLLDEIQGTLVLFPGVLPLGVEE